MAKNKVFPLIAKVVIAAIFSAPKTNVYPPVANNTDTPLQEYPVDRVEFRAPKSNGGLIYIGRLDTTVGAPVFNAILAAGDYPYIIEAPLGQYMNLNDFIFAGTSVNDVCIITAFEGWK
jgi:hypothetical protein